MLLANCSAAALGVLGEAKNERTAVAKLRELEAFFETSQRCEERRSRSCERSLSGISKGIPRSVAQCSSSWFQNGSVSRKKSLPNQDLMEALSWYGS